MKYFLSFIFLIILPFTAIAQQTVENYLQEARHYAEMENYTKAIEVLEDALSKYPGNEEAMVMIGRVYSWNKNYDSSLSILKPLADKDPPNPDAIEAIANTFYWSADYAKSLEYCNRYLDLQPKNESLQLLKARSLEKLGLNNDALAVLDHIELTNANNAGISLLRTVIGQKAVNAISASYLNVSAYNPGIAPLHYGYVEYARKFNTSTLVGRINAGHVNNDTQMLFEADYYKTFTNKNYLYLNAGVSTGKTVFPVARAGVEYYFVPYRNLDYSIGLRYMHFETEDVTLVTGQLAYNFSNYTIAYRPFYDTSNELVSHVLSLQKVNEQKESLIRFELQYGNVPYLYLYNSFIEPLTAYRAGLQYQFKLANGFFVRPVALYEYEEYLPQEFRHRMNAQIILTKRF